MLFFIFEYQVLKVVDIFKIKGFHDLKDRKIAKLSGLQLLVSFKPKACTFEFIAWNRLELIFPKIYLMRFGGPKILNSGEV